MVGNAPKVGIGVIGLGIAGSVMIPAIVAHRGAVLAAVADPNALLRRRVREDHDCLVFETAEELLASSDVDAVYVATPHHLHRAHVVAAAQRGKHVIVEKPMALSLDDCDAMIAACEANRVALVVGHTHSFDPAIRAIHDLIKSGQVGRLSMISMWNYTDFIYRPRRPEELDTSRGGGILFNQIPHQVDIIRLLSGSGVTSVLAKSDILDPTRPTEGCCVAFLQFANGAAATLTYSGYDRFDTDELHDWVGALGQQKVPSHGATRRALLELGGDGERQARAEKYGYGSGRRFLPGGSGDRAQPHCGIFVVTCERADIRQTRDGLRIYTPDGVKDVQVDLTGAVPSRGEVIDELLEAVAGGHRPLHDGHFARGTVETCLAILESSRRRREVTLPADQASKSI